MKVENMRNINNGFLKPGILLALLFLFYSHSVLWAATIHGVVRDLDKKRLPNVEVTVKSTGKTTLTDLKGSFLIEVPDSCDSVLLIFKCEGCHLLERRATVDDEVKVFDLLFVSRESLLERVSVTAMNQARKQVEIPMAESSVSRLDIQAKMPENIIETLSDTPGVHFIGSGGFSVTPTIRGLARRRVLLLLDGARITSDRRAGTSASFIPPEMASRIEVVRSSSSVLYGSDAIGGVVNILTRSGFSSQDGRPAQSSFNFNVNSTNSRINTGLTLHRDLDKWHIYTGFQYNRARDYGSPGTKILHSGYTYYSGIMDISYHDEKREFYIGYAGGVGSDIGKPDRENNPDAFTTVPLKADHFLRMGYTGKNVVKNGSLDFSLFLDPTIYNLDKVDRIGNKIESADTTGLNLGVKATLKKSPSRSFAYQAGVEWFSRQNVRMENRVQTENDTVTTFPLREGERNDYSVYLTFDYSGLPSWVFNGGIRYTYFSISAVADGAFLEKTTGAPSFFLGATRKITKKASLFFTIARAFRFPSLGEAFYTGLTGRRYVIGNPALEPESSLNIDIGLKMISGKWSLGAYLFAYTVDGMIERYRDENDIYTYDNINRGRLYGGELEVSFKPVSVMDIFGHFIYYHGRNPGNSDPLNDIPAPRLLLGGKAFLDRLWLEFNFLHSFEKSDPGPAEVFNNAYTVINLKGGYYITSSLYFYIKMGNILNQSYYANPDPDIPFAKGANISAGLHFNF